MKTPTLIIASALLVISAPAYSLSKTPYYGEASAKFVFYNTSYDETYISEFGYEDVSDTIDKVKDLERQNNELKARLLTLERKIK